MLIVANAGVPMLVIETNLMVFALLPIIAVEVYIARRLLGLAVRQSIKAVVYANLLSTFVGCPLAWLAWLGIGLAINGGDHVDLGSPGSFVYLVMVQAPWTGEHPNHEWIYVVMGIVLLVPAYFVSVFSERLVLRQQWKQVPKHSIGKFAWVANAWSYSILLLFWLIIPLVVWIEKG